MTDLFAARTQMALSLGFHILFASISMALPAMMVIAEALWLRTRDEVYLDLAQRWAKGAAILFAIGAVSGTVLSFEMGLLWPRFMEIAGPMIGLAFSMEGYAFFIEAIFLGIYLYGWKRVSPRAHLFSGVVVALSGALSAVMVVSVNGWMNTPTGFRLEQGRAVDVDPVAALFNPAWGWEAVHMLFAAYAATGMAVAGLHAFLLLRDRTNRFHRRALGIALALGGIFSLLQPLSGDFNARFLAERQPRKLAALEGQFRTERGAPLRIGGIPDEKAGVTRYALEIPNGLSLLAKHHPQAQVKGLEEWPRDHWPRVEVVHVAFQIMVGCGFALLGVTGWAALQSWRGRRREGRWTLPDSPWLLRALVAATPLGFLAIETGWIVTEVGRQPWIIDQVMRTSEAVTPVPNLQVPLVTFAVLYLFLAWVVILLMLRLVRQSPGGQPVGRGAGRKPWDGQPAGMRGEA